MRSRRYAIAWIPVLLFGLTACQAARGPESVLVEPDGHSLTLIASELQMHLREDTYRTDRARTADGRNVFSFALWRLERMQEARNRSFEQWENVDIVIEFARARSLERLRRFTMAADAYDRVANTGSVVSDAAEDASFVMRRFAQHVGPPIEPLETPEAERAFYDERVERWTELAWEYRQTMYEALAFEEAEAWDLVRIDSIARHRPIQEAIEACKRLLERHASSKYYPEHLIRLGDLYAEAARQQYLRSRAKLGPFDTDRYEALLDHAFSAYELAEGERGGDSARRARTKINALMAYHEEVLSHAQ